MPAMAEMTPRTWRQAAGRRLRAQRPIGHGLERSDRRHADGRDAGPVAPYDHDPRVKRNPAYAEIKASIRERGLDAPPAITRRPGETHYIIRNGGNTRLAILRELWSETKEERFFRISCLFRPGRRAAKSSR
jgi:hypothetical protein